MGSLVIRDLDVDDFDLPTRSGTAGAVDFDS